MSLSINISEDELITLRDKLNKIATDALKISDQLNEKYMKKIEETIRQ